MADPDSSAHNEERDPIAFLGLGRMGNPMAGRLVEAGFAVLGHDPSPQARERAATLGCVIAASAAEAVASAAVVITMLPDENAVRELAYGEDGVLGHFPPGALWIEMTSSMPAVTRQLAGDVEAAGGSLVDAPVSGGVRGARAGQLTVMAAGAESALDAARPLLEPLSNRIVFVGDRPGAGDVVKSLNNMLSAVNLTAAQEALAIALREGVDPRLLVDAVGTSTGASNAMEVKVGQFALAGRFDTGFTLGQYLKDLRIALTMADSEGLAPALATKTRQIWSQLGEQEGLDKDHTEVVPLLLARAGLELPVAEG